MSQSTEVAVLPKKENALQAFSNENGLDPYLKIVRAEIDSFVPDISTAKGRKEVASVAYKVAQSKTALDNMGKELVAEYKEIPKKIDAERKRMRELLDSWKDEVRKPLTEYEEKEAQRIDYYTRMIQRIVDCGNGMIGGEVQPFGILLRELQSKIVIDESWCEFEAKALREKDAAIAKIEAAMEEQSRRAKEQAELERLRAEAAAREIKEREEQIAKEASEKAMREAEAKAKAEREAAIRREAEAKEAAEKRELELKLAAERAEREKAEAQRRAEQAERDAAARAEAAAQAERQRQADEQAKVEAEARAREADKAHKKSVNNAALADLVAGGLTKDCAKQAITLIAQGKVSNTFIKY